MPGIQQPTKTPISESKIAVFWRTALYLFSAGMMGKAAAGFSDGYVAEAVGDLGLSLVFIGMCFRSTELAILAYISDPAKREAAIEKLRQKERAKRPWISHLMNAGWICLLAGVAGQLSNIFESCRMRISSGGVPEWLKGADCKSVGLRLRWFESIPLHHKISNKSVRLERFLFERV